MENKIDKNSETYLAFHVWLKNTKTVLLSQAEEEKWYHCWLSGYYYRFLNAD